MGPLVVVRLTSGVLNHGAIGVEDDMQAFLEGKRRSIKSEGE